MTAYTLVVQTNAVEGREDEFNDWYSNQHLADVLKLSGFKAARRFKRNEAYEGPHKYMALYEMETTDPVKTLGQLSTSGMYISDAMDKNVSLALFESITPLVLAES